MKKLLGAFYRTTKSTHSVGLNQVKQLVNFYSSPYGEI